MPEPKNLIIFVSDNHTRRYLGINGHPIVKTPSLDSIAARGTNFTNAYCASPLCCPSRAAIATGRYPNQTGYWDNALAYDGRMRTWHHRVRAAGYQMTAIGKLHFRSVEDDNGFSDEIDTMHIVNGKGALISLLRATAEGVPSRGSHLALYEDSVPGDAEYQVYDRRITAHAVEWLHKHASRDQPWVLFVSYPSPHPPFKVPQRFWDMYPLDNVPMPTQWRLQDRPRHPAVRQLAWMNRIEGEFEEFFVRRVVAGYCGLITHTDEQIGIVLDVLNRLGLSERTRIIYTSDHGEAACQHGMLGKSNLYEHSAGVPLIMAGPDIPKGWTVETPVSHVDLFPTILEAMNIAPEPADTDLPGKSLWKTFNGEPGGRAVFAEYHALGSISGSYLYRKGDLKLIYHVGMPIQLFDLQADPLEENDLAECDGGARTAKLLEKKLRVFIDPEQVDAKAKGEQRVHMVNFGGPSEIRKAGFFSRSPMPGGKLEVERV